jgi:MinD-like ATPase involved in chromosome partitioning or flagellar assembly
MYVVTFYSFKGGVGRTLALVNVGCALAAVGRRVLMIDFDLEAPGLDTFSTLQGEHDTPGVLDFVDEYIRTGSTPDVRNFVYAVDPSPAPAGALWIMPAGRRDESYGSRLSHIDWHDLYENRDGYLMFEDLKAQWNDAFRPDYVLVDSRTGHTDVSGICTRQLPDAVVVLFFPNDQNLLGLQKVVSEIRQQPRPRGSQAIELHFVTSNVPDLDDEDRILAERMRRFKSTLEFRRPAATIHHYDSLALLNQSIFTVERPRSRLALEYQEVVKKITTSNPHDRNGALIYLKEMERRPDSGEAQWTRATTRLEAIKSFHAKDGELLFALGRVYEARGALAEALTLYSEAESSGAESAELFLRRARILRLLGEDEASTQLTNAAWKALNCRDAVFADVAYAIRILRRAGVPDLHRIAESPSLRRISDEEKFLLLQMELLYPGLESATEVVVDDLLRLPDPTQLSPDGDPSLSLALISLGRFDDALRIIRFDRSDLEKAHISAVFNSAMAEWGTTGQPSTELFDAVVRKAQDASVADTTPNYHQCLALAHAVVNNRDESLSHANQAARLASDAFEAGPGETFSCWRYLNVEIDKFVADTQAIVAFATGIGDPPPVVGHR